MLAYMRPTSRDYHRFTPSCFEKVAGRASAPPKSPVWVTFATRCASTGRAKEGRQVRRDDSQEIIMDGPRKMPRPGKALGAGQSSRDGAKHATPTSTQWLKSSQIRRRFGSGIAGYESAKAAWQRENPAAAPDDYCAAMRRIARAVKV